MIETRVVDVAAPAGERPARLAVHLAGRGPLALLIHGFPLDHRMWIDVLLGPLTERRTLCAVDLRGHGASPWCGDDAHTMERLADDVAAVIRALADGDGRADVAGLSMGGYVAFALQARHPELVRSLVLSNTRAGCDTDAQRAGREQTITNVVTKGRAAVVDAMLPNLVAAGTGPLVRARLRTMIEALPVESIVADLRGLMAREDRRAELPRIAVPALVVAGHDDPITPVEEARLMASELPNARLEVVPGTAHMTPMERPDAWSGAVARLWS